MAAFRDDQPLVQRVDEDWDEISTGQQIMRPEWDFSPIRMRTMHHLPHIFFDTLRPERPDCPVLVPSSFSRSRDRIINMDIYSYEPCGLPTGNFMPAEKSQIRLMTASPITLRACIPAPDQVTPQQAYFKDLDFYKKTLFHTPFLSRRRAVTLLEYRDAQQRATHRQKRNYDSKAVARAFPINCWTLRYYPPARKNKLCSPWIGPYKVVRAPMEWVVGIQLNADARIIYVHMDDLKRCAPPDPEPTWPDAARGTSVVVSTRAPSTLARSDVTRGQSTPLDTSNIRGSAHHTKSTISGHTDLRAPTLSVFTNGAHHMESSLSGQIDVRAPPSDICEVKSDTVRNSMVNTYPAPSSAWDLQDENCLLSMKSQCSIDVQGYRFFTMERLFYALQLLSLGDRKFIGQLAKYSRMDYVRKCVNTRFEMASSTLQNKWLDEQFQTWAQIISARVLSDSAFKDALLDSAGSPLFDPEEPVYATALTSARRLCVQGKTLSWPTWISVPTRVTRGRALI